VVEFGEERNENLTSRKISCNPECNTQIEKINFINNNISYESVEKDLKSLPTFMQDGKLE